eukprot:scaffold6084_cov93-Skeletonema_dohrnii-CCMP3373.AAC.1
MIYSALRRWTHLNINWSVPAVLCVLEVLSVLQCGPRGFALICVSDRYLRLAQKDCKGTEFEVEACTNFEGVVFEFEPLTTLRPQSRFLSCTFLLRRSYVSLI